MLKKKMPDRRGIVVLLMMLGVLFAQAPVLAQDTKAAAENKPDRLITMAVEYPGLEVFVDETVNMNLIFANKGKSDEDVNVQVVQPPENWKVTVKTYKYTVTGVHVSSGENKTLTFEAEPNKNVQPGKYEFHVEAQTPDGQFKMAQTIVVTVKEKVKEEAKESKGVKLNTTYPVLRGPTGGTFEFSITVNSELNDDAVFDLAAQGPQNWDINFKPYEAKYISSIQIKGNQSQSLSVEIKPPADAKAGEYPIKVRVSSGQAKGEIDLTVMLTGTYSLEVRTTNDLLSLDVKQGQTANISFYIKNTGSAPNSGIKFMTIKPENWKVEFKPDKLDKLEPGSDWKQVEMLITPADEALIGDYSVAVEIQGEKVSKTLEFRTTVKASAAWGWVGIGIIVIVVAGLTALFRWLGRR